MTTGQNSEGQMSVLSVCVRNNFVALMSFY